MRTRQYGVTQRRSPPLRLSRHLGSPVEGEWDAWVRNSTRPIAIDLFCGAGGLSHGLEAAGYRVALAVDLDEWALESHAHNVPGPAVRLDLGAAQARDEIVTMFAGIQVDLIAGGPPCQPFSRAGRSKIRSLVDQGIRDPVDLRKDLWRAFLEVVERIRPRAVLMENVPDMALGDDMIVLRAMIDQLEQAGYEVDARIVDAWRHGVPQHRQRLILVGIQGGGMFNWPGSAERVTVSRAIADLPVLDVVPDRPIGAQVMAYSPREMSDFARKARKECTGSTAGVVHDHVTRPVREDDFEAFKLMSAGTLYSDLPAVLKRYRDDIFTDKYNRLDWSDLSRTITAHLAKDGYWYIHPDQHRTLTIREAARLQTFPDTFRFAGSRSHQFQQIGNAVPPALGEVIGSAVLESLRQEEQPPPRVSTRRSTFRERLALWAQDDKADAPWAYPGDAWPVAVGLLSATRGLEGWLVADQMLRLVPDAEAIRSPSFRLIKRFTRSERHRKIVTRIAMTAAAVVEDPDGWASENWRDAVGLGPSQRRWFDLLTGESTGLVASAAALRVASRVSGTSSESQNSTQRMELAKLIGSGEEAAVLNVAMHRFGTAVCKPRDPDCHLCPVAQACIGSAHYS